MKSIYISIILILLAIGTSCKDNESIPSIVGLWECISVNDSCNGSADCMDQSIEFKSNGTWVSTIVEETTVGQYSIDEKTILFDNEEWSYSINNGILILNEDPKKEFECSLTVTLKRL